MSDLYYLSVTELAPLLRERKVSPVEVVNAHLDRIEKLNPTIFAYLHVCADRAQAEARAAEIAIGAGGYRGPLHGIPVAYKDIYDVAGLPTTAASKILADNIATEDSTVAARLHAAGAICLGKLNTFEFASGSMETFGTARNPWNPEHTPGGSSSGSGAALAAGMIMAATGSDTGGSIRMPASFCGVAGIKPTYGRVSRAGIYPLSWSLDHAGPLARRTADLAPMLTAMAGPDARDPSAAGHAVPDYAAALAGDLKGLRIGVPEAFFYEDADPEVVATVRAALDTFRTLGAEIREIALPTARFGPAASWSIAYTESFAIHRTMFFARPRDYTPPFLHKISAAACLTAEERITAQRIRQVITAEFLAALGTVDIIVTPTTGYPAHRLDGVSPAGDMHSLTRPVSLTGLPALALPCGFTSAGLPVSAQLVGRAWDEALLLRAGHAFEGATDWHTRRPKIEGVGSDRSRDESISGKAATPARPEQNPASASKADAASAWVLDFARLTDLSYVTEADAERMATALFPVKELLAEARDALPADVEPPVRPAP